LLNSIWKVKIKRKWKSTKKLDGKKIQRHDASKVNWNIWIYIWMKTKIKDYKIKTA
jgi:hypothetical protein